MDFSKKNIIIIEGPDASGKSELANHLRTLVDGKCHILHSNYNKSYPGENNYRQHKLMAAFASRQFNPKYYTGNRLIIFDRSYISDIVYGQLGYGSKGNYNKKLDRLENLLKALTKNKDVDVTIIACNPVHTNFNRTVCSRDELLKLEENQKVRSYYDYFFALHLPNICRDLGIKLLRYDFNDDPYYAELLGVKNQKKRKKND